MLSGSKKVSAKSCKPWPTIPELSNRFSPPTTVSRQRKVEYLTYWQDSWIPDPEDETTDTAGSTEELSDRDFEDSNAEAGEDDSDDEEEGDTGPDPEEVKARFETLRVYLAKAEKMITKKGRDSREGKDALSAIGDVFSSLKLTPKVI